MYAGAQDVVASRARHVRRRSLTTTKSGAYSPARGGTGMGGGTYGTPTIVGVGGAAVAQVRAERGARDLALAPETHSGGWSTLPLHAELN